MPTNAPDLKYVSAVKLPEGGWRMRFESRSYVSQRFLLAKLAERGIHPDDVREIVGNLHLEKADRWRALTKVSGKVIVDERVTDEVVPRLKEIRGDASVRSGGRLPALERCRGHLTLMGGAAANKLQVVDGDLDLGVASVKRLVAVGGQLSIDDRTEAPELRFVGGQVDVVRNDHLNEKVLKGNPVRAVVLEGIGEIDAVRTGLQWIRYRDQNPRAKLAAAEAEKLWQLDRPEPDVDQASDSQPPLGMTG